MVSHPPARTQHVTHGGLADPPHPPAHGLAHPATPTPHPLPVGRTPTSPTQHPPHTLRHTVSHTSGTALRHMAPHPPAARTH
eukprot:810661-Prorocentrum_minimum.AAC.1